LGTAVGIDWHRSAAAQQGAGEISGGNAQHGLDLIGDGTAWIRYAVAMCR